MVRAVRESVFYETSADPIRFSLLGLDLITRQQEPSVTPSVPVAAGEAGVDEGGTEWRGGVAGQDRWFFTFLLCKLLSG